MSPILSPTRRGALVTLIALLGACVDQSNPAAPHSPLRPQRSVGDVLLVTSTDGGADVGSLRAAVNLATGGEVIRFDPSLAGKTIALDTTLVVPNLVTIEGPADKGITISGGGKSRVLDVRSGASLRNLSITGGKAFDAGGILARGALVLEHSTVWGNEAVVHAGISGESVTLINSTVTRNTATGGTAGGNGGGIAISFGGNGALTLTNSTVSRNSPMGIAVRLGSNVPGIPTFTFRNSIVSNNGDVVQGTFVLRNCEITPLQYVYEGRNISDNADCGNPTNMVITDPLLGSLADNGGPTPTLALDRNSAAINRGSNCSVAVDQRFIPRDAKCDIGAFEFVFTTITVNVDPTVRVDVRTGSAVIQGTIKCSRNETLGLALSLDQSQRAKRIPTVLRAAKTIATECGQTPQPWIALLEPPIGQAFESGDGTVSVESVNTANGVSPVATAAAVKLAWSKK